MEPNEKETILILIKSSSGEEARIIVNYDDQEVEKNRADGKALINFDYLYVKYKANFQTTRGQAITPKEQEYVEKGPMSMLELCDFYWSIERFFRQNLSDEERIARDNQQHEMQVLVYREFDKAYREQLKKKNHERNRSRKTM